MRNRAHRPAFTLIELLVVVGMILVLTTIVLAINIGTSDQRRVQRGAEQLQGWLLIAKQRAIRDRAPRGLRLNVSGSNQVTELVYIERPEPWTSAILGRLSVPEWDVNVPNLTPPTLFDPNGKDYPNGTDVPLRSGTDPQFALFNSPAWFNWRKFVFLEFNGQFVQPGDVLEIIEPPSVHVVSNVYLPMASPPLPYKQMPSATGLFSWFLPPTMPRPGVPGAPYSFMLELPTPVPGTTSTPRSVFDPTLSRNVAVPYTTEKFRITRLPQPLVGESTLQMPKDVAVLTGPLPSNPATYPTTSILPTGLDILFGPDGRLIGATNNVILWLDDTTGSGKADAQLIVIYARTGLIGTHPVDRSNPPFSVYSFTADGQSSGL
jgi:prepilin-type N-terminal cleavage/methylation domain-containing protein